MQRGGGSEQALLCVSSKPKMDFYNWFESVFMAIFTLYTGNNHNGDIQ